MPRLRMILWATAIACVTAIGVSMPVSAQEWPERPIRVVTPLAPGGAADVLVRTVGEELTRNLKQQIVVENRPGGGGSLAAMTVQRAAPDGYTLLLGSAQTHFIAPLLVKDAAYDPLADFTPLTIAAELPLCLVVPASFPANNLKEFIAYAKANPGKLSFGSSGTHTTHHLAGEYFKSFLGLEMVHIPYRGGNPAMTDLLAGQIPVLVATLSTTLQYIDSGKIKVLAMMESQRSSRRPEIPTVSETAPGFAVPKSWLGFLGPAHMPPPLTQKVHAELVKAITAPGVRKHLEASGFEVATSQSPEEFAVMLRNGVDLYRKIKAAARLGSEQVK